MNGCTLNKFKTYNVGQVHHNLGTGAYSVQISDAVERCPTGTFNTKKAKLVVQAGTNPSLGFDTVARPVITVPSDGYVINYGESGFGFGTFLIVLLGFAVVFYVIRRAMRAADQENDDLHAPVVHQSYAHSVNSSQPSTPVQGGGTTVINNHTDNGSGLLTGLLIGEALAGDHHSTTNNTTIIERERVVERNSFSDTDTSGTSNDDSVSSDSSDDSDVSSDSNDSSDVSSDSSDDSDYSSDDSSSSDSSSSDF